MVNRYVLGMCGAAVLGCTLFLANSADAHGGPPLDNDGCHADRVRGNYHCDSGELRGRVFRSRGHLKDSLESGDLPEADVDDGVSGFVSDLLSLGDEAEKAASPEAAPAATAVPGQAAPTQAAAAVVPGAARSFEERLRVLSGLREMELISDAEYQARRQAILDEL